MLKSYRQAIEHILETIEEPFDFHQVWAAVPPSVRGEKRCCADVIHHWSARRRLVRVGWGPNRTARYRRRVAAAPSEPPVPLSKLELAWREFRAGIVIPDTEISTHSLTTRHAE